MTRIGYKETKCPGVFVPLEIDLESVCHWLIVGGSGSGKTIFLLYVLNRVLSTSITLYIADFKGSGDFLHLAPYYAEFEACEVLIRNFYQHYQKLKKNKSKEKILLLFDEYAGFLVWLESQDKKRATEIKGMLAEILMQGRALPGGGSAWFWCVCQRADSIYFSHGARDNYMLTVALGRLSKESRGMLFSGEELPEYTPGTGKGLISIPGRPVMAFQVPKINKDRLRQLLQHKAADRRSCEAAKHFRRPT